MISKQIVEKFGGTIDFSSKIDEGSTFTFTFKLTSTTHDDEQGINSNTELHN